MQNMPNLGLILKNRNFLDSIPLKEVLLNNFKTFHQEFFNDPH